MIKCEICGRYFKSFKSLSAHIRVHKITSEEYYLKYINSKGKCKTCESDTKFISVEDGYTNYCTRKCMANDPYVKEKRNNTYYEKTGYYNPAQNPTVRIQKENTNLKKFGYKNPAQNSEVAKKAGYNIRMNFTKLLKKHPELIIIENLKEGPNGEVLGHCKNANCYNSSEKGGSFTLTTYQIQYRNIGINSTSDGHYFYCCEECKQECVLFNKSAKQLNNIINPQDELSKASQQDLSIWRTEVFSQQLKNNQLNSDNFCEICHKTENLVGHHELPQKLYPEFALDPDNGIVLCEECHTKYGHIKGTDCSTGNLANKICK